MALSGLHMPNRPCLDRCEFGSVFMGPNKPIELYLLSFTFFSLHSPRLSRRCHASAVAAAGEAEVSDVQAEQLELSSAAGKVILRDTWAQKAEVAAAAGSLQLEGVEADELSVSSAVGGASLKQVTAGDLEIGSALGSIQLEDVWADSYTKAGIILHTSGQIQKR